jgi:hypothetical protein
MVRCVWWETGNLIRKCALLVSGIWQFHVEGRRVCGDINSLIYSPLLMNARNEKQASEALPGTYCWLLSECSFSQSHVIVSHCQCFPRMRPHLRIVMCFNYSLDRVSAAPSGMATLCFHANGTGWHGLFQNFPWRGGGCWKAENLLMNFFLGCVLLKSLYSGQKNAFFNGFIFYINT